MPGPLSDPVRVAPELAALVRAMLADPRALCRDIAAAAVHDLETGHLVGIQTSSRRGLLIEVRASSRPLPVEGGAICQCEPTRSAPRDERDLVGWIVTQDGFRGGSMVLAHELTHFRGRGVAWQLAEEPAPMVEPALSSLAEPARLRWIRSQLVNEVAARHAAWLAETGATPENGMPARGALFACAVKIASYPAVYADVGPMTALVARGDDDLLRDQVGLWLAGLERFPFFEARSPRAAAHAAWLADEVALAREGRRAPRLDAEGTLLREPIVGW